MLKQYLVNEYQTKPSTVKAIQFNGSTTHANQIIDWMDDGCEPKENSIHTRNIIYAEVVGLYGRERLEKGDYVVKDCGEFFILTEKAFNEAFEPIE